MHLDQQLDILMQGTEYGDKQTAANMRADLRKRLELDRPLRVYCGYDPTSTDLHLGHTITMRKLRQFQKLGHEVTFLIGSYTALVGDQSDKNKARPILTQEQVTENGKTYTEQAFRILDPEKTNIRSNGEWLSKLSLVDLIRLGQNFTVQQFLARENFSRRWEKNEPIYLHESFYALMQGYDAVALEADVQVGGTDQLFNIIVAGRKLQEALGQTPQVGIIMSILPGTDGVQRMSKSTGNHIPILATAEDMYGKIMALPDVAMPLYSRLITRWTPVEIAEKEKQLEVGELHPRDAKMALAYENVSIFHGNEAASIAEDHFKSVFQQRSLPADMPELRLSASQSIVELMAENGLASSKGEARRLIKQGGVRLDGEKVDNINLVLDLNSETILQVGKRKFAKLIPK